MEVKLRLIIAPHDGEGKIHGSELRVTQLDIHCTNAFSQCTAPSPGNHYFSIPRLPSPPASSLFLCALALVSCLISIWAQRRKVFKQIDTNNEAEGKTFENCEADNFRDERAREGELIISLKCSLRPTAKSFSFASPFGSLNYALVVLACICMLTRHSQTFI